MTSHRLATVALIGCMFACTPAETSIAAPSPVPERKPGPAIRCEPAVIEADEELTWHLTRRRACRRGPGRHSRHVGGLPRHPARRHSREHGRGGRARQLRVAGTIRRVRGQVPQGAVLILHGEDDANVPVAQAKAFYAQLKAMGADVDAECFPGAEHALPQDQASGRAMELLERALAPAGGAAQR